MTKIVVNGKIMEISSGGTAEHSDVYSTDEVRIGTWIDGKPVYRKVFKTITGNIPNSANRLFSYNDMQIDTLVSIQGIIKRDSGTTITYPWYLNGSEGIDYGSLYLQASGYVIEYHGINAFNSTPVIISIKYTKTTDQATITNSFNHDIDVMMPEIQSVGSVGVEILTSEVETIASTSKKKRS